MGTTKQTPSGVPGVAAQAHDADSSLDLTAINTIRTLSMDAVQKANSGHPGTPMALAPVAYMLWRKILRHNPKNPHWTNRDRFVLSNGHASMLLYSLLHLFGYNLSLDDIKQFRQWGSNTPGHPEYGLTDGVETTTGPLGQGVANSVGMAIAERWLASRYNQGNQKLVDYRVYAICGDGDLMEGVSQEAASIAGHLKLSNLLWIYDNNHITIEGNTKLAFSDDVGTRFEGYGWTVQRVSDANDLELLERAVHKAIADPVGPQLIVLDTHIAWGAPNKQDTAAAHGEPLGEDEIKLTKKFYGWPEDEHFFVPEKVYPHVRDAAVKRGQELESEWKKTLDAYTKANGDAVREFQMIVDHKLPDGWDKDIPSFPADAKGKGTRETSGVVQNAVAKHVPWLLGGAADLAPSTKTLIKDTEDFEAGSYAGRNFHFGIREHAMGSILNGMALSGLRPYGATFLIFSDYMKPPIRLAALMDLPVIFIYTHDSIGLGEDGPTHQPIEQVMALRATPRVHVVRPADANEVAEAWRFLMNLKKAPAALVLTRQAVPTFDRSKYASAAGLQKGAYVMADCEGTPEVILMGTGSEVQLCVGAYEQLKGEGIKARVVSMPCWEAFEHQSKEYKDSVLPPQVRARVAVEAGTSLGWKEYVGSDGKVVARSDFGASAPIKDLLKHFGFTVEEVVKAAKSVISNQ
ncbi:MAG: transketolase [Terriglobales bacterium]